MSVLFFHDTDIIFNPLIQKGLFVISAFFYLKIKLFSATKKGFICLLYLCTRNDETRLVSSVGLEYDATNVGGGSSNLSRVTNIALWWTPLASEHSVRRMVARQILDLKVVVRILSNSQSWSVHLIGQDCRFSFCPHEFESRTDYKRFNSTAVVQLP